MTPSPLPWGLEFTASAPDGCTAEWHFDAATSTLHSTLTNGSNGIVRPDWLRLEAPLGLPSADGLAWVESGPRLPAWVQGFGPADPGYPDPVAGETVLALSLPVRAAPVLVAGSLDPSRVRALFTLQGTSTSQLSSLTIRFEPGDIELAPGESLELPPVLLLEGRDLQAMLEEYADRAGEAMGARVADDVPAILRPTGDGDALGRALAAARDARLGVRYVLAGDDWRPLAGDWLTAGAEARARAARIREAGFEPALALAPLLLHAGSNAQREHPEIVLRDPDGELILEDGDAVIDVANPAGEAWLRELVRTAVQDWGYRCLVLEGLLTTIAPRPGTTYHGRLRLALEVIREAASDAFIVAKDVPFGPGIGLVDATDIAADGQPFAALMRGWMHRRWWLNAAPEVTPGSSRAEIAAAALSGGVITVAGDLAADTPEAERVRALLPPTGVAAKPYDPGEAPMPSAWRAQLDPERALVGVFNFGETARWVATGELLLPGEVAFDPAEGRQLGMGDLLLRPGDAVLLQVAGRGKTPRVVGDTGSLAYHGLFVRQVSGRVQVRNDGVFARTVAIEARGRVFEVDLAPGEMRWFD